MSPGNMYDVRSHAPDRNRLSMGEKYSEDDLFQARATVANLGSKLRELKKSGSKNDEVLEKAVVGLLEAKKVVATIERNLAGMIEKPFYTQCRSLLENLARRRSFFFPSFEIYGGAAGLFDWGPPGCALKYEVENLWRRHFILAEDMLEISGTCLTPTAVLRTSGHEERFCDLVTTDMVTGEKFRADKLLQDVLETRIAKGSSCCSAEEKHHFEAVIRRADALTADEISELFTQYGIKSPLNNPLSKPAPFNLMFKTNFGSVGSTGSPAGAGYLRPETAQGIFVNFRRLLEYNVGKMPFAVAQLGLGFRNEIAPRNGLMRVREFQMAEIEHFVDPMDKTHPKFEQVAALQLPLYSEERQLTDGRVTCDITLKDAVHRKMIGCETLAYFMARTYLFLLKCGIQARGIRFRQHLQTEMAHYASDCWDAEIETSFGWVECVGHADRAAYDLTNHANVTKIPLVATRRLKEPETVVDFDIEVNKARLGPVFKNEQQCVIDALTALDTDTRLAVDQELDTTGSAIIKGDTGREFKIDRSMVRFIMKQTTAYEQPYIPSVIEPSFGLGRIIYAMLEHCFRQRADDPDRNWLAIPPALAPVKCSLLPISNQPEFSPFLEQIKVDLLACGVTCKVDQTSATIGKRYARTDEIGIPFGITVDFQTLKDRTVTLRERDTTSQLRLKIEDVARTASDLSTGKVLWADIEPLYPKFSAQQL